eukprot:c20572_g1_i3.p1 GENE.c20572_g1_i3~~c20572_g1_i3.p1  ORF type:complete len:576 (+),score=151.79 c20572_g1_i3:630-2357(+)
MTLTPRKFSKSFEFPKGLDAVRWRVDHPSAQHVRFDLFSVVGKAMRLVAQNVGHNTRQNIGDIKGKVFIRELKFVSDGRLLAHGKNMFSILQAKSLRICLVPLDENSKQLVESAATSQDTDEQQSTKFEFELLKFEIHLIQSDETELAKISLRDLSLEYGVTDTDSRALMKLGSVKLTNSTPEAVYQKVLAPRPRNPLPGTNEKPPMFALDVTQSRPPKGSNNSQILVFDYIGARLLATEISIEQTFLMQLLTFFEVGRNESSGKQQIESLLTDNAAQIKEVGAKATHQRVCIKTLTIDSINLNVSYNGLPMSGNGLGGGLLSAVVLVLSKVNELHVRLDPVGLQNQLETQDVLIAKLLTAYQSRVLNLPQVFSAVGSLDALGNPQQFVSGVSTGVKDLFLESARGFKQGSPLAFGKGVVMGSTSFVSKTIGGVGEGVSKITGAIGTTAAALTFDSKYQSERDKRRATDTISGLKSAGMSIVSGFSGGVVGIVESPRQGLKEGGFGGLMKGVGKGMIGLVTKPVSGVADAVSHTTQGISQSLKRGGRTNREREQDDEDDAEATDAKDAKDPKAKK